MTRIPIYDATAPIACTAGRDELPVRKAQIARLRDFGPTVEPTEHGILLHFPNRPNVDAEVRDFTVAEKGCCTFWGFEITSTPDRLTLRWDAPPDTRPLLHGLAGFFAGSISLDALGGLL